MPPWRHIKVGLVEKTGGVEQALDFACDLIVYLLEGTSMGMMRAGKKGKTPEYRPDPIE